MECSDDTASHTGYFPRNLCVFTNARRLAERSPGVWHGIGECHAVLCHAPQLCSFLHLGRQISKHLGAALGQGDFDLFVPQAMWTQALSTSCSYQ